MTPEKQTPPWRQVGDNASLSTRCGRRISRGRRPTRLRLEHARHEASAFESEGISRPEWAVKVPQTVYSTNGTSGGNPSAPQSLPRAGATIVA